MPYRCMRDHVPGVVGRCLFAIVCVAVIAAVSGSTSASNGPTDSRGWEERHTNCVLLDGDWEYAIGHGDEHAETPDGAGGLKWQTVKIPGQLMPWNQEVANSTRFVWTRRAFTVSAAQAECLAVLRWNQISNGAVAFINGRKVGENVPTGPYQVILPTGSLKAGDNLIVLKVTGAAAVPKAKSGSALIPAGFGPGMPAVLGAVWIDFADSAYMKWILALPDIAGNRVRIRVTLMGVEPAEGLTLSAEVRPWPQGQVLGSGEAPAMLNPDPDPQGGHSFVEVPMPDFKPWTYESPSLYTADVTLKHGQKVLDAVTIRFGMREITIKDGDYFLNGKTLRFRGSNLVFEWNWGDTITGHEVDYLVTEAREMSMNAFRTHTMPPPPLWADICDENGTMILAEFPCLYNYQDYKFTPEEYAIWHKNVLSDAAGWLARLWNHPAVVMWVLSNESNRDSQWESGPYHDFVRALDPTRPTMRTGDTGTAENYDVHTCGNVEDTLEGNLIPGIPSWFREATGRPVTNSEYMNYFGRPATQWTGEDDKDADALACAQIGAEHTEAMRRARLDGMLPYMYAGWTRTRLAARVRETGKGSAVWKGGYASPLSACWHSSLSPVLASLDLFDPSYLPGQEVRTDLYLINDSWHDAAIHVDLLLTQENPEFIPEAACFNQPLAKWSYDFTLKADTLTKTPVAWKLPDREGSYWLTARTTGLPGRAVLSQRFVRAVQRPQAPATLLARRFVVLGGDAAAEAWFQSQKLQVDQNIDKLTPGLNVVVIWNAAHLTEAEKRQADAVRSFAAAGGRVVVLATRTWDWTQLCDIKIGGTRGSRAFPYEGTSHSMLAGIPPEWLARWNGLPGTVAVGSLDGPALATAEKLLWVREPKTCVAAEVPVVGDRGTILFSQLDVQRRVDHSQPNYDPVAEQTLINSLLDPAKLKAAVDYLDRTIAPPESSRVPQPLRQGEFLCPQSVSALAISPDGRQLAVTTMAFRHDRNFWLLADDGRVLWGRYLEPWAPGQVAFLPQGKRLAVGLAYSRFTDPNPTLALFDGENDAPIYGSDDAWELGWMRYGLGHWRTGWMASPLADMLTATAGGLFATPFHLDDKATEKPGPWCRRLNLGKRAWRMAASADGRVLVCGYFAADNRKSQVRGVASLESPGITLAAFDGTTGMVRWKTQPISPPPEVPLPPEPTDEFRPLAEDFHFTPSAMVPFQAALSVAASRDGDRVACTEYGGYARIGQERIHPNWSPRHPLWLCPRQHGTLRVFGAEGEELARAALPEAGLFEVHLSPDGSRAWCVPMSWFARGLAGCPWLPADDQARRVFVFDLARQQWSMSWHFPDAVSDFAVHPQGQAAMASCWNGRLYLVRYDGAVQATIEAGGPAKLRWSADGRFAIAGTQQGEIWRLEADGAIAWHSRLPVRQAPPAAQPLKPVFEGIPIYRVGRVGPEHAYVGDIWLIKTPQGGILVDSGGTSAVSLTLERIKAAGVDPRQIHYLLLSHTHGDHVGGAYLWRSMGAKVVAPAPAAFPATWMVPTLNHYGIWVPCAIDQPLPLARPGDTTHFTLDGLDIQAIFVPGHSFDTVVYVLNLAGRRVFLTGDIGFHGNNDILNRCWGDLPKARRVMGILREQVLPLKPEIVFTGHDEHSDGVKYWQDVLDATEEAIRKAEARRGKEDK